MAKVYNHEDSSLVINEFKNISTGINLILLPHQIEILECNIHAIIFNAFEAKCVVGQLVSLEGYLQVKNIKVEISFVGKITEVNPIIGNSQKIELKLNQYDKDLWGKFISSLQGRQNHVDHLLNTIKGED